jgi:hypothetical protein
MIDLPLVHIIPSIIYSILTFFLTGLRRSVDHFFIFLITNLMAKIFGSAMCYFVAASTSTFGQLFSLIFVNFISDFRCCIGDGYLRLCNNDAF